MTLYRCTAHWTTPSGRTASIRMHFSSGATLTQVESDWKTQFSAAWSTIGNPLKALYPTGMVLVQTKTESLQVFATSGTPVVDKLRSTGVAFDALSIAGTSANPGLPDQNALVVSLRSALPGREGRGRVRLPAPDQTIVTNGAITSTVAGHITTAFTGVRTGMSAAGHAEVIPTYTLSKTLTAVGSTRAVTSEETDEVVRTVRGRMKSRRAVFV